MPPNKLGIALASLGMGAAAAASPTVVVVESLHVPEAGGEPAAGDAALGFVVEASGFLVTTYKHLTDPVTGALRPVVRVTLPVDGEAKTFAARIVGVEPTLDFAVLKIDQAPALAPAQLVQKEGLKVGQEIYTVAELAPSTEKLVLGRLLSLNSIECYQESLTQAMFAAEMVQPDAAIGSPVFDREGEVIALYTGYEPPHDPNEPNQLDDESEVHLLPVHLITNIYESLKQRQSQASPWTGFSIRSLTPQEQARFPVLGGKFRSGIALEYVWENSPAAAMGLEVGDILLQFAHHPVASPAEFQKWLYLYGVGHDVSLYVLRGEQAFAYDYTIEERPEWAIPR